MSKDKKNNTGEENTGENNSGDRNSGYRNSGYSNSGDWNSGNWNSGYSNSGDRNSGYGNSGYSNSGDWNSGNWNSGNWNSGDRNSGDWNSGDENSGIFNTDEPFMRAFNKETNIKMSDWRNSDDYICFDIPLNEWIYSENMTEEEKKEHPEHKTTGGYLKTFTYKEAWANFWKETDEVNRKKFLALPNFDEKVFEDITGIKVGTKETIKIGNRE
jgi:hypothetical protein